MMDISIVTDWTALSRPANSLPAGHIANHHLERASLHKPALYTEVSTPASCAEDREHEESRAGGLKMLGK